MHIHNMTLGFLAWIGLFLCFIVGVSAFPYTFSYMQPNEGQITYDFNKDEAPSSTTTFSPTNNYPPPINNNIQGSQGSSASPIAQTPSSSTPISGTPSVTGMGTKTTTGTGTRMDTTGIGIGIVGTHVGAPTTMTTSGEGKVWCISKPNVDEATLMGIIVNACGEGKVNCAPIQPSGACFKPNTLTAHASFVMNLYYQHNQRNWWTCHFNNTGLLVFIDPSYGECIFSPQ